MWRDHWRALVQRARFALTPKKQRRWLVCYRTDPAYCWIQTDLTYGRDFTKHEGIALFTQANAEYIAYRIKAASLYDTTTMRII